MSNVPVACYHVLMANNPDTTVVGAEQVAAARPFVRALCITAALVIGLVALGTALGAFAATMDAFDHIGSNRVTLVGVGLVLAAAAAGLLWVACRLGLYGCGIKRPEPHGFPIEPLGGPSRAFEAQ